MNSVLVPMFNNRIVVAPAPRTLAAPALPQAVTRRVMPSWFRRAVSTDFSAHGMGALVGIRLGS